MRMFDVLEYTVSILRIHWCSVNKIKVLQIQSTTNFHTVLMWFVHVPYTTTDIITVVTLFPP